LRRGSRNRTDAAAVNGTQGGDMYIGLGTLLLIIVIILLVVLVF
jgi:hypothetical protein